MGNQFDLDNLKIVVDKEGKHKIMLMRKDTKPEFIGDKYDDFEQIKKLGNGCFGEVWLVKSKVNGKEYAMKKLDLSKRGGEEEKKKTKREIEILKTVHHPNIVKFYTSFEKDRMTYIVIEYVPGKTLEQAIEESKKKNEHIPEKILWKIMIELLSGLTYLHDEVKIIHRDIKPDNILITDDNHVKITDFGISAINKDDVNDTVRFHNSAMGPILFMAPEIGGEEPYTFKIDVWMLGLTFYKLMAWGIPYAILAFPPIFHQRIKIPNPPPLPDIYSDELKSIVLEMNEDDPNKRPTSKQALEVITDIYKKKYIKYSVVSCLCKILSNCNLFYKFIIDEGGKNKDDSLILYQFYLVFQKIKNKASEDEINNQIKEFRMLLGSNKTRFMGFGEVSSTLLIHYIIPQMHQELCKNQNSKLEYFNSESIEDDSSTVDHTNKKNYFKNAIKEFDENYKCQIAKQFYGINTITETCDTCKKPRYFLKEFYFIIFPLQRASAHFDNSKNLNMSQLFEHYQKKRNFVPSYCPICKKKEPYVREIKIEKPSKILLCSIDRKTNEDDIVIDIPEKLDISKFLSGGKKILNLVGVIYKQEKNDEIFYSCIYNEKNQYYYYNEGKKEKCSFNDIKNKGVVKILIYQE